MRNTYFKVIYIALLAVSLNSCDAYVRLTYVVSNESSKPINVFVPHYAINGFDRDRDTIFEINPREVIIVGNTLPRISGSFRAGTKKIYRQQPGLCGLKLIKADTTVEVPCTEKKWKYRHGCGMLIIRK